MTIIRTITKNVITRAWTDIEPKVLTFLATGVSASLIVTVANYLGWDINPGLAVAIATVIATIAGYIKHSTSKVVAPPLPVAPVYADPSVPTGGAPLVGA